MLDAVGLVPILIRVEDGRHIRQRPSHREVGEGAHSYPSSDGGAEAVGFLYDGPAAHHTAPDIREDLQPNVARGPTPDCVQTVDAHAVGSEGVDTGCEVEGHALKDRAGQVCRSMVSAKTYKSRLRSRVPVRRTDRKSTRLNSSH